ncbi:MAG: hypothetical protein U0R51_13375 [Solirubrobacterales bacterium]
MTAATDRAGDVVAELIEESAGLRSCAVIDGRGEVLAATDARDWAAQTERLWAAAADPGHADPAYVHVAIDAGELFAMRDEGFTVIGIADRFSLASLILCDLRAALRRLEPVPA